MSEPRTKLSRLLELLAAGDEVGALAIAARFPRLGVEERVIIMRAHNAILRPGFYRELGLDPDELRAAGVAALRAKYVER
jgi:hypothetical protein